MLASGRIRVYCLEAILEPFPELRWIEEWESGVHYLEKDFDKVEREAVGNVSAPGSRLGSYTGL